MRKGNLCALMLACLLLLSGCQELAALWQTTDLTDVYDSGKYAEEYSDKWQYSHLDPEYQAYYGSLYTAVTDTANVESTLQLSSEESGNSVYGVRVRFPEARMTHEQIVSVYEAFFKDNPQFFFLDRTYQLEGHSKKNGITTYNTIVLQYSMAASRRAYLTAQLEERIKEVLADCPTSGDYEKELYLHDWLNAWCTYDKQAAASEAEADPYAYTAYGALVDFDAVCEGYAKAMQLLLQRVGIPCTLVTGRSGENDEAHMWNLVRINGNTYHLDPTWNDSQNGNLHTYFNLTTASISATHTIDENQTWLAECTATADNYFVRNDCLIDTYEREKIAEKIAKRVQKGDQVIQLSFAKGKFENGLLFLKNTSLTTQYVNAHLNGDILWAYTLWVDEGQRVLTIRKKSRPPLRGVA